MEIQCMTSLKHRGPSGPKWQGVVRMDQRSGAIQNVARQWFTKCGNI